MNTNERGLAKKELSAFIRVYRRPGEFFSIVRGILDEIFDQSAYRRHLAAHGVEHSGAEWRRFCDEHWAAKARRGRCC